MKSKKKIQTTSFTPPESRTIVSAGELFADGVALELMRSADFTRPNLLMWSGSRVLTVETRAKHGGCTYEAPELPPTLARAMRLPSRLSKYGSARHLFNDVANLFRNRLQLSEVASGLLAGFSISTWLTDSLPMAPRVVISGPDLDLGMDVLRLLNAVCRRPLMLGELSLQTFRLLPMGLSPTLLISQQSISRSFQQVFMASSQRGLHLLGSKGDLVDFYSPKAMLCGSDIPADTFGTEVIHISVSSFRTRASELDGRLQDEIADAFQSRLLQYRLTNLRKPGRSDLDLSHFTFTMRPVAVALAMCFPEDSKLASDVVELLKTQDDEIRGQNSRDVNRVIVEILLGMMHAGKHRDLRVHELAKDVNAILRSRDEIREYSAEEIGWKLRDLNIPRHVTSSGRQVLFGKDSRISIHRLARAYNLIGTEYEKPECSECGAQRTH